MDFYTNGRIEDMPEKLQRYYYAYDACDGRQETGAAKAEHRIVFCVEPGKSGTLELLYTMGGSQGMTAAFPLPKV